MQWATLAVAIVGLVLAAVSLGWQAATFLLTGPRVTVSISEGMRQPFGGGAMVGSLSAYTPDGLAALELRGYTEQVIVIGVVNRGRLPVTVNNWSLVFGMGAIFTHPQDPTNPTLPYRLEAHSSAVWTATVEQLAVLEEDLVDQRDSAATVRGTATLGNGSTVRSQNALLIRGAHVTASKVHRSLRHPMRG